MKKYKVGKLLMICIISIFMMIPTLKTNAEETVGNMNMLCLCGTDEAKNSFFDVEKILVKNKLPGYRLKRAITHAFDNEERPSNVSEIDSVLDSAFSKSTSNLQKKKFLLIFPKRKQ